MHVSTRATRLQQVVAPGRLLHAAARRGVAGERLPVAVVVGREHARVHEHVQRIVQRYKRQVGIWNVVSGVHAFNSFNLTFEQLMELTRMTCLLVKKLVPRGQVMIELAMPWGE